MNKATSAQTDEMTEKKAEQDITHISTLCDQLSHVTSRRGTPAKKQCSIRLQFSR
jgi:hypothetical protein